MQIDWWTLALQAINFLILVWLLSRFLYRPVKGVIEKRKALAEQAFAEAAKKQEEAEKERAHYLAAQRALTQERQDMLAKAHQELDAERAKMLDAAKAETQKILAGARKDLARERAAALDEMRDQAAELAVDIAARLLGQSGAAAPADPFLEQLETRLKTLPDEERRRLQLDLAGDGARLTIVTAAPLAPEAQKLWSKRLAADLGAKPKMRFEVRPEILGGAELHFPHAVMKLTWADQLNQAREALTQHEASS